MLKLFLSGSKKPDTNAVLQVAIDLEKDGYKDAALHIFTGLVEKDPSCQACR
jgi:hypothetical protein